MSNMDDSLYLRGRTGGKDDVYVVARKKNKKIKVSD